MKRSGFKTQHQARPAKQIGAAYTLRPREAAVSAAGPDRATVAVPKARPLQNKAYMAAVRCLPCIACGIAKFTQFCHADEGKGMSIKTDCRLGWPGCGPRSGEPGCHWYVGTSGEIGKAERRAFERQAGAETRAAVRAMGAWPADLPEWPEYVRTEA